MENGRKIAPKPMRKTSKTRVVYEAIDTLGGVSNKKDLYAQVKLIWQHYREDRPPRNLADFTHLTNTVISQGYLVRFGKRGPMTNCDFEISDYETFVKKQIVQITSRALYTLGRVENGEQVISEVTQEKLQRQLDDPAAHVNPPRIIGQEKKPEPIKPQPEAIKPQTEPNAPTNMEELLSAAEKIVARQQPSQNNQPVTKVEVPVITAIVSIGIAGLVTGAVVCLGVIALSW